MIIEKLKFSLKTKITVVAVSFVVSVLLLELFLHIFPQVLPLDFLISINAIERSGRSDYASDSLIEHRALPGIVNSSGTDETRYTVKTNTLAEFPQWGWRTEPYDMDKPLHSIILGDSFAFGHGVEFEQTVAGRLARYTKKQNSQIINLGLSNMTGSLQYEILFNEIIKYYEPRNLIIFHFENEYIDNLFFDAWQALQKSKFGGISFPKSRRLYPLVTQPKIEENISLPFEENELNIQIIGFRKLWANIQDFFILKKLVKYGIDELSLKMSPRYFSNDNCKYVFPPPERLGKNDPFLQKGFDLDKAAMQRIIKKAEDKNINVFVFMIPLKQVIAWQKDYMLDMQQEDALYFYNGIAKACSDAGAIVIDPMKYWKDLIFEEQLYFTVDGHWSPQGHSRAYELLIKYINEQEERN
jgi:hypothetical protein